MVPFDICVLTAANERQAMGYEKQIEWRQQKRMLPEETEFRVYADPGGKRIGSGGSTLYVLNRLLELDPVNPFAGKRILILHSGGDSRRLPAFSVIGKLFTPIPSRRYLALFDVVLEIFQKLPVQEKGQVIVGSGDVVLNFDSAMVKFNDQGITGVAYPEHPAAASGYGVYVVQDIHPHSNPVRVADFLQKPDLQALKKYHALDAQNRAMVDTGIMNLASDVVEVLVTLPDVYHRIVTGELFLHLYEDFPFAMLGKKEFPGGQTLKDIPFNVSVLPYCGFFHVGKSKEFLQNLYSLTHAGALYDFTNFSRTNLVSHPYLKNAFVYNSIINIARSSVMSPALVENCIIEKEIKCSGYNMLTGVPKGVGGIELRKGICLTVLPVYENKWVAVIYGLEDTFKDGQSGFMNQPFDSWLREKSIEDWIWAGDVDKTIWKAKLFPVHTDPETAVRVALSLQTTISDDWKNAERMSMQEILLHADHTRILEQMTQIQNSARLVNIKSEILSDPGLSTKDILSWCRKPQDYQNLAGAVESILEKDDDILLKARLEKLLAGIDSAIAADNKRVETHERKAFGYLLEAVGRGLETIRLLDHPRYEIRTDEVVWVSVPARLDFGGGWSDTPPICLETGGCVLNAAVKLNGQYPIQVIGKRLAKPVIRINSIDLGARCEISDMGELCAYADPRDWLSLPKSAFVASGVIDENKNLESLLNGFGGGIDLTLFSALPSGSGLGTSSILGSAIITCLARMFNVKFTHTELFRRTLYMEQLMTTGGGWQDQIGGVVGGVKLIRTDPGLKQVPTLSWTHLKSPGMNLGDHFLLYYTGYRRMAKNILQQIVGRYLDRNNSTLESVLKLKDLAVKMKIALDHRRIEDFGRSVAQVWELNKQLDQGSSNTEIDQLFEMISDHMLGAKLLGAGGGGFLFIVTKSPQDTQTLKTLLNQNPPNNRARFFDFDIDTGGMHVSVL